MAQGDIIVFNVFYEDMANGIHNCGSDVFKLGIITSVITPTRDDATPRWGVGSGQDYDANEVTPGGNYATGGPVIASTAVTIDQANDHIEFDGADTAITQHASNPTNARWGIIYNETAAANQAVGYIDFGSVTDLSAGDFNVAYNANGIWRLGLGTLT